jgi:hypothetical protein
VVKNYYGNAVRKSLISIYPEHPWDLKKFMHRSAVLEKDNQDTRTSLEAAMKDLSVKTMEDWYSVTVPMLQQAGRTTLKQARGPVFVVSFGAC